MNRGQLTIVAIFGVALLTALFGQAYRFLQTREVLEFWGPDHAGRIASPDLVRLELLEPADPVGVPEGEAAAIEIDGHWYRIVASRDVMQAPGMTNARHALARRDSYDWNRAVTGSTSWRYALQFSSDTGESTVLLSADCMRIRPLDGERVVSVEPISTGLATVFQQQLNREMEAQDAGP